MPPSTVPSLRFALRDGTRQAHEQLDACASRLNLSHISDYGVFLAWHAAIVPGLERQMERRGVATLFTDWADRRRSHLLVSDLAALGRAAPREIEIAITGGRAELAGLAYVLEGSRLGGAMLVKNVDATWRGIATRYLDHGAGSKLWPSFVDRLNAIDLTADEIATALAAANRAFGLFQCELDLYLADGALSGT